MTLDEFQNLMFSTDETLAVDLKKLAPMGAPVAKAEFCAENTAKLIDGDVNVGNAWKYYL